MKKQFASILIFALAGLILAAGIWQLSLYIPPQLKMLDEALDSGATATQVSDYYWQQFMPQVLSYAISAFGFASALFAAGVICLKLTKPRKAPPSQAAAPTPEEIEDMDDLFEDFELVDDGKETD